MGQLSLLPKTFKVDLPSELVSEILACKDDSQVKQVGVEWAAYQSRDLIEHGIQHIHYYSHNAVRSVQSVVKQVF